MDCTHIYINTISTAATSKSIDVSVYNVTGDKVFAERMELKETADISRAGLVGFKTREDVIRFVTRNCDAIDLDSTVPIFGKK